MHRADADLLAGALDASTPSNDRAEDTERLLDAVDNTLLYAFQPIVNIDTGIAFGYEALLRGVDRAGYASIAAFFDTAHAYGVLEEVERRLQRKAVEAFLKLPSRTAILFLNVDARLLASGGRTIIDGMAAAIAASGLSADRFCLELPETQDIVAGDEALAVMHQISGAGVRLALDDFGQGYSRLRLLHELQPNFVKIDRYFVNGVSADPKRRLFLSRLVDIMHVFGIAMVAEGVETEADFRTCKDLGFDYAQGYLIQKPTTDLDHVLSLYPIVAGINARERRNRSTDKSRVQGHLEMLPTMSIDLPMVEVFDMFRQHRDLSVIPVVDQAGVPVGVVGDADLKGYAYSPFGRDLIANKAYGRSLRDLVRSCPTASVDMPIEKILEIFAHRSDAPGILMVERGRYAGFMSSTALLKVLHEKTVAAARDQNPLTRLPGNLSIGDWVNDALEDLETGIVLAYFDFDSFKPFNDTYGFRNGDRAIQLFAELLQKHAATQDAFVAHIGGDDFFVGFRTDDPDLVAKQVATLIQRFAHDVESFYDAETRERGFLEMRGRDGRLNRYGLLSVSAGLLNLRPGRNEVPIDTVMDVIARLKKEAKQASSGMAVSTLG
ncbi:GGDEF domain-containing protein [Thalassobaculum sp. OXR-137]|uniref:GGDEF domain-containing protein n=1 Tax=Thalassobaculum sp. OXR-137 TaxID=3100173 RepID=UPI002AC8E17A|nr:GGDEF domain-containing protein [Thalassobaculum sp. OXR-137]WPZ35770.1 GGDEF domain-containing protein [Thalassobaculum sp. OXR-137]